MSIEEGARRLGLALERADGQARFSGHAMRVGGIQSLARAGFDPWLSVVVSPQQQRGVWVHPRRAACFLDFIVGTSCAEPPVGHMSEICRWLIAGPCMRHAGRGPYSTEGRCG